MRSLPRNPIILVVAAATLAVTGYSVADRIELRRSIRRVDIDQPVRLEDVARLEGEHASRFRRLIVVEAGRGTGSERAMRLTVDEVRERLEDAGVDWPRVELSGGVVAIRPASRLPRESRSIVPPESSKASDRSRSTQRAAGLRTVREWRAAPLGSLGRQVAELVVEYAEMVETDPDRLYFTIDSGILDRLPSDLEDIRATVVTDRREEIGNQLDSMLIRIQGRRLGEESRAVHVRIDIRVDRRMPVANREIRKGRRLSGDGDELRYELRPVRPSQSALDSSAMIDRRTRTTVSTGDVVLPSMLEPEAIVARGSDIMLRSTVDGHEFNFLVECTEDGCLGDLVECRTRSGRSMKARVIAPNMAEINPAL